MPVHAEDIKVVEMVEHNNRSAGVVSGVVDTLGYDRCTVMAIVSDRVGTARIRVAESDSVSGTFSGMTAIPGFDISGITTSNTRHGFIRDLPNRYMGVHVSNAGASSVLGVLAILTGGKRIPGSDTASDIGFANLVRYPSGS